MLVEKSEAQARYNICKQCDRFLPRYKSVSRMWLLYESQNIAQRCEMFVRQMVTL